MNEGEEHLVIPQSDFDNVTEVYIHMGSPKTATTSIQQTLHAPENFELLKSTGYLYPRKCGVNHSMSIASLFAERIDTFPWVIEARKRLQVQIPFYKENIIAKLKNEIVVHKCSKLIISSEAFEVISADEVDKMKTFINKLFPNAHIKIIFCTRETVAHVASMVQQLISTDGITIEDLFALLSNMRRLLFRRGAWRD